MYSNKFKELLLNFISNDNKIIIGTIFYDYYEWLDEFRLNPNIELIEVTLENRNEIPRIIINKIIKPL